MFTLSPLSRGLLAAGALLAIAPLTQAQVTTDVLVRDGAGNVIANNVRSFDENEAGSGLAIGFGAAAPAVGQVFTFLYQANIVAFNNALGQTITPMVGLNQSFGTGGYEYTLVARINEMVNSVSTVGGTSTATFSATGGSASFFFDNVANGGVQSNTSTGAGFDDGHLVGLFDIVGGAGFSTFTTTATGIGIGATRYDFNVRSGTGVQASFIQGLLGPVTDLHFTSNQVLPVGTSATSAFHTGAPSNAADLYATTAVTPNDLLLKVDGSNTFTSAVPEPETYALMLAGLGALGFVARRRRQS